jgi:hypothetical protein
MGKASHADKLRRVFAFYDAEKASGNEPVAEAGIAG